MNRSEAIEVLMEISKICNGCNIEGITLDRNRMTDQYSILIRISPAELPKDEIQPILDKHELVMREQNDFVFLHSSIPHA